MSSDSFEEIIGLKIDPASLRNSAKEYRKRQGNGCFLCDYFGYTHDSQGKTVMCSCLREKFLHELYVRANVPRSYYNSTVDDWNTRTDANGHDLGPQQSISEKVYQLLKFYDKNIHKIVAGHQLKITHTGNITTNLHSLLFEGSIGSGKTFIASVLVQSAIKKNLSAKYYDWADLVQTMSDFDKKSDMDQINEEFKTLDFIALDGVEIYQYMPNQMIPQLDRICKSRLNCGKPIVIMTFGNINSFNGGSGWASLLRNSLPIRLPQTGR
jgi:DNA replication protein DnaC